MIALKSDALVFATSRGELIPCSAESVVVELVGESASLLDPQMLREAASAVLHHFKVELGKPCVTVGEFAQALAQILRGYGLQVRESTDDSHPVPAPGTDLRTLASGPAGNSELFFFQSLRTTLRDQLAVAPGTVRFSELRACVMRLTGARRWSKSCQRLQDHIVAYLRDCMGRDSRDLSCLLVVR